MDTTTTAAAAAADGAADVAADAKPRRGSRNWMLVLGLVALLLCGVCVVVGVLAVAAMTSAGGVGVGDAVAVVYVEGVIVSGNPAVDYVGGTASQQVIRHLEWAEADGSVKAIVLRVDSPGGGVVASDEIYEKLLAIDKPIVVSMGETAASGGYYIACAADKIVANPATMTGSIGVISQIVELDELLAQVGVEVIVIKSGAYKDVGAFHRDMTDDEVALFQAMIDEVYEGFVDIVAQGRGLPKESVRGLADGRVYTGLQARQLGLVDELGNLPRAIALAAEMGGIEGKPRLIEYRRRQPSLFDLLLGMASRGHSFTEVLDLLELEAVPSLQFRYVGP